MSFSRPFTLLAGVGLAAFLALSEADAQSIGPSEIVAYLDTTTTTTPRLTLTGSLSNGVVNGKNYKYAGVVVTNFHSTPGNLPGEAANAPGTTFGFGVNTNQGNSQIFATPWNLDLPLPVAITTDPANPTYISLTFFLVDENGDVYPNLGPFTYCFLTYNVSGKVITSPAAGPYSPPLLVDPIVTNSKDAKAAPGAAVATPMKPKTSRLPAPKPKKNHLQGFWDGRPTPAPRAFAFLPNSGLAASA